MQGAVAHYEDIGPTILAGMPVTLARPPKTLATWMDLYGHCESRLGGLRVWRYSWWQHMAELAAFILPYRYHWVVTANTMNRGNPVNQNIIDNTATRAMRVCASGLSTGLMSPSRPWFRFASALPNFEVDEAGKVWLEDTADRVYAVLGGSNFYTTAAQMFQDVATFGTSPMIIYEDHEDVIRCYLPCAGEYYLATGARLSVDTLYREYTYTVSQIVEWFGLENCPNEVQQFWQQGGAVVEREFVVAHAIEPNFGLLSRGGDAKRLDVLPGHFEYREVYWLRGRPGPSPLSLRGFNERPFMVSRWSTTSNDAYGRGPGMDALGDTKQLQAETREKGRVIQQISKPSMGAEPELNEKPSSILPGEITYVNTTGGKKGFWPLFEPNPQAIPAITADITEIQKRIDRAFYTDVFLMITQMEGVQPRNELEIAERKGEKIQQLGPVIELFETEFASPCIQRVVSIMHRRGLLKPPPPSLANIPVAIEYVSMMKLAQKAAQTAAMERGVTVLGNVSANAIAAGEPSPMRIINMDRWARRYLDEIGFPATTLYSEDDVAAADQAKAQAKQQQDLLGMVQPAAQAARSLGQVDVGGGQNAVQALLGTQPAPGNA